MRQSLARRGDATRSGAGEGGFVAGGEALALGVVVFVMGSLLVLSAWRLVDGKLAVETAAREAARGFVEAPLGSDVRTHEARGLARDRARSTMVAHRGPDDVPDATWEFVGADVAARAGAGVTRCAPITATVTIRIDTVRMPLLGGGFGTVELTGEHTERIEPYRSGLPPGGLQC